MRFTLIFVCCSLATLASGTSAPAAESAIDLAIAPVETAPACNPYRVNVETPRLATPQWVGEPDVEAVVILSIDDMREAGKYESFLRPILNRLKQIDGRAPVSIFTNSIEQGDPQLQTWLKEGLSIEVHTVDHPCPLLKDGDFAKAKSTYDRCVDAMSNIKGNRPVAFRMPCCDSLNTPSPRFWMEIFNRKTPDANYLSIDSSVFNIFTSDDADLPRELVEKENGRPRFRDYVPFTSFVNTIENYPYPYIIGDTCWEFPCVVPSDWEAQHVQQPNNPDTLRDLKRALDATVIKQGVMPIVFHPHGWIRNDQLVDFVEYAHATYGGKVKFLNFAEALNRINDNLLDGVPLRTANGNEHHVRLVDVNHDGFMDVLRKDEGGLLTRVWQPAERTYSVDRCEASFDQPQFGIAGGIRFFVDLDLNEGIQKLVRQQGQWGRAVPAAGQQHPEGVSSDWMGHRVVDIDGDGSSEVLISNQTETSVLDDTLSPLPYSFPAGQLFGKRGQDTGIRLVDLNADERLDIVKSDGVQYGVWVFVDDVVGWKEVKSGRASDRDALPAIVRRDGSDNGAWFHSAHMWVQNEYTARLPDLVDRVAFTQLTLPKQESGDDEQHPLGKARTLEESIETFDLVDGAELSVVASEPQIQDPVAFDWAADGKLWVVEMGDYPNGKQWHGPGDPKGDKGGRLKLLEDRDGDGHFETAHLMLDGLDAPTGVKAWRNGAIISVAPDILYVEDSNGDNKVDVRRVLFTGLRVGNQQHRANGLRWGLDHWLHVANGDSGGVVRSSNTGDEVNIRGRDFRIQPDTGQIELTSGPTQFGRNRDSVGNWFGGDNSHPVWHYVLDERYMRRNKFYSPPPARREIAETPGAAPIFPTSETLERFNDFDRADRFTSACSPEVFRDDRFLKGDARKFVYVCEPVHNLVHRSEISQTGVTFASRRAAGEGGREFFSSSDNWFRPTMIRTSPESDMWIADMYRMVIEHPEWIPKNWQDRIDHLAGNDKGRIYRVRLPGRSGEGAWRKIRTANMESLVGMLDTSNSVTRDMVQQEIYERNDRSAVAHLKRLLSTSKWPHARIPVLYLMDHFDALDEAFFRQQFLEGTFDRHVLRLAEPLLKKSPEIAVPLFDRLGSPDQAAKITGSLALQLACTLGEFQHPRSGVSLANLALAHVEDRYVRAAVASSVTKHNLPGVFEAVLAAEQSSDSSAMKELVDDMISIAVGFGNGDAVARLAATLDDGEKRGLRRFVALLEALRRHRQDIEDVLEAPEERQRIVRMVEKAIQLAADTESSDSDRISSLGAFGLRPELAQQEQGVLAGLLTPQNSGEVQSAAIRTIRRTAGEEGLEGVFRNWAGLTPAIRDVALSLTTDGETSSHTLLQSIEQGSVLPVQVAVRHRQQLLNHRAASVRERAAALFAAVDSNRTSVIDRYAVAGSLQADAASGKAAFKKHCSACHQLDGVGNAIGPDLSAISDKSMPAMLTAILDPNRAVEEKYLDYTLITEDGRTQNGLLFQETATAITLAAPNGDRHTVLRNQIDSLIATGKSLMPEGLEQTLTEQNVADIVAYVQSVSVPPKRFAGNTPRVAPVRDDASIRLFAMHAEIYGPDVVFESKYRNLGFWKSPLDRAVWTIDAPQAGRYELLLDYACSPQPEPGRFQVRVAGQTVGGVVEPTNSWDLYRTKKIGMIDLPDEPVQLTIQSDGPIRGFLFDLRTILLYPEE